MGHIVRPYFLKVNDLCFEYACIQLLNFIQKLLGMILNEKTSLVS